MKPMIDKTAYDQSHGSPWDRGSADSYYYRPKEPHYWPEGTGNGVKVTDLTPEEVEAYHAGYEDNEKYGEKKNWG
jgi:hypothetical protein